MSELPRTLEDAIVQARVATQAALADGYTRLQVELLFPELKPLPVAQQFLSAFDEYGERVMIGEIYLPYKELVKYYGQNSDECHLPYNFKLIQ